MNRLGIGFLVAGCLGGDGCDSSHHTTRSAQTPTRVKEPVVHPVDVRSPDGKRVAVVRHDGDTYDLEVGPAGGGPRRTLYRSAYISSDVFSRHCRCGADHRRRVPDGAEAEQQGRLARVLQAGRQAPLLSARAIQRGYRSGPVGPNDQRADVEPTAGSGKRLLSPSHGSAPWTSVPVTRKQKGRLSRPFW